MSLFYGQRLSEYFDDVKNGISNYIHNLPEEQFTASSDEQIIEHVISKYEIEPIEIYEDRMVAEPKEGAMECLDYGVLKVIDAVHFYVELPFTGNMNLWNLCPSTWRTTFPKGSIKPGKEASILEMCFPAHLNENPGVINKKIKGSLEDIRFYLEHQANDIQQFNSSIPNVAKEAINKRRSKLKKRNSLIDAFEIPLKQSPNAPDFKPLSIERKLVKPLPSAPAKKKEPEYCISDEDYEHILNVIRHEGATFEATPQTYKEMGEEGLRDVILAHLNGHYEGDATGETFRNQGKTDIRIEFNNRAAFVGECKIWRGEKRISETIDQLLGYLTWRDSKTCIILFNKENAGFASIQQKVPAIFEGHPNRIRRVDCDRGGEWRYFFKSKDDEDRHLAIHVFMFNLYVQ